MIALLVMVTVSRPGAGLIAAATGPAMLGAAATGLGLLRHSDSFAPRASHRASTQPAEITLAALSPRVEDRGWQSGSTA